MHDKLYKDKIKQVLWRVPGLKPTAEEYVRALLMRYEKNGITKEEVEKVIEEMEANRRDLLDDRQCEAVSEVLRNYFTGQY